MTVKVKIAFDGTNYCGSQIQKNGVTVFGVFQEALIKILGYRTDIKGCSRTDSGVHAKCYYLSFDTREDINLSKLPLSLNANLPFDIRAIEATNAPSDFHARYSAKAKEYTYYIKNSHVDDPFNLGYYYRVPTYLEEIAMDNAARYFIGRHDFTSFMSEKSKLVDCTRTVFEAKVSRQGDMIIFKIKADGYLYNMIRIMAGTLINVGSGKLLPQQIEAVINARERTKAGFTAPACGLFLTDVIY